MTALRRRMLEDMQVRHLSAGTQQVYLQHIARFARYCGRSPAVLGPEEIRAYQLHLTNEKQLTPATLVIVVSALRFLYRVTLHKTWSIEAVIPAPKKPQTLPVVLSPAEVVRLLDSVKNLKHRTILTTCYAAGLRISEAVRLTVSAIDSQRMVLRIVQGKGQRDRYVMLSPTLLVILRDWWRVGQPQHWLFPGKHPERVLSKNPIDAVRRADSTLDARRGATFVPAESLCSARPVCRLFPKCCSSSSWPSRAGSTSSRVTSLTLSRKRIASSESRSVLAVSGSPTPSAGAWPQRPRASGDGYSVTCTPWSRPRPSSAGIDS